MNIVYKSATEDDASGIAYVSAHSWKETYSGLLPDEYLDERIKNVPNKIDSTKSFLTNYLGDYIVAKDGDDVIGILSYTVCNDEKYIDYGYLEAIYVLKKYQGYGIGKELFRKAIIGIKSKGYNKMKLECMVGNPTLGFYKKYLGNVVDTILYHINGVGSVKAYVLVFEDLDEVIKKLN